MTRLVVATRGSALALRQVELVAEALAAGVALEMRIVKTQGDIDQTTPLETLGGQGIFVKEIERALLAGEADIAVHSLKDMPAQDAEGLMIGAVLPREDARDVLVGKDGASLVALRPGARVGTDSKRRAVQLLALRGDIEIASIRGNVDSRVRKVESGEYDAVALAAAGLKRLGLIDRASQVFEVSEMVPAVGQGVIAVQCRKDDSATLAALKAIDDAATRSAVTAERAFLKRLGAGCRLPVGAYAEVSGGRLDLRAFIADDDGRMHRGESTSNPRTADIVGRTLAEGLLMAVSRAGGKATGLGR